MPRQAPYQTKGSQIQWSGLMKLGAINLGYALMPRNRECLSDRMGRNPTKGSTISISATTSQCRHDSIQSMCSALKGWMTQSAT